MPQVPRSQAQAPARNAKSASTENDRLGFNWHAIAPYAVWAYCAGVLAMLLRTLIAWRGGRRLRNRAQAIDDPTILSAITRQAQTLGLRAAPIVASCHHVAVPVVVGVLKPIVLLPLTLITGLSTPQLEAVLAHELAHIRRYDPLVLMLQRVIESVLFFR